MLALHSAQQNLFASGPVGMRPDPIFERIELSNGAWVDMARGWLGGADEVADYLIEKVDWQHHKRWLYDRMVDEPRVNRFYSATDVLPHPALDEFRAAAGAFCGAEFGALGLNFYRHGQDSVAFHGDRELRFIHETSVAILTLGAQRPWLLRPKGGGKSVDLSPASGDVFIMRGTCQETWEHGVPKTARPVGPRVSASIRWAEGRAEREWTPPGRRLDRDG